MRAETNMNQGKSDVYLWGLWRGISDSSNLISWQKIVEKQNKLISKISLCHNFVFTSYAWRPACCEIIQLMCGQ